MPALADKIKHVVVLMMSGRSFDHMLGSLKAVNPQIDGLTGSESNPDHEGNQVSVQPLAKLEGQFDRSPDHHFPAVDLQIFGGGQSPSREANMSGFVNSYYNQQQHNPARAQNVMHYFTQDKLPVLASLATNFAVFNRWFASVPGPGICNRAFAQYGTSFGQVGMEEFHEDTQYKSIYERMALAGRTVKFFYYDVPAR